MTTQKKSATVGTGVAEPRITVNATVLGETPDLVKIELGGILEFTNTDNEEYPYFKIEFVGANGAPNTTDKLTGSNEHPILVHMPYVDETFEYCIYYAKTKGGHYGKPRGAFKARSCPGCPPTR
jgi:hypothetical protein